MSRIATFDAIAHDASTNMARAEADILPIIYLTPEQRSEAQRTINSVWRDMLDGPYIQAERGI